MNLVGARQIRSAFTDARAARNDRGTRISDRFIHCATNIGIVGAIAARHVPARRGITRKHIFARRHVDRTVDGDLVVVPQHLEAAKAEMTGQTDRLMIDAFHEAAVARDHPGAVIDKLVAEHGIEVALGHREADSHGEALAERTRGRFHARQFEILGMTGTGAADLTELADLLHRRLFIARQVKQRIDQHGAMTGRQDEPVAIGPFRRLGIILQIVAEQHGRHVGHAHRHAGMAAVRRLDGVHRQHADCVGKTLFSHGHIGSPSLFDGERRQGGPRKTS